jgi:hypothetical protein
MKLNLVLSKTNWTSFHQIAFADLILEYFNIIYIEDQLPPPKTSLLVSNLTENRWYQDLHNQGYPLIVDLLWGVDTFELPNSFSLINANWFWYHEALLYQRQGLNQYIPNRTYVKKALMPMGLRKKSHDLLFDMVTNYLDDFIYSYVERLGKYLPDDAPANFWNKTEKQNTKQTGQNQRYFNPIWYDSTYFSLVSETTVNNDNTKPLHITEKSFKPMAFYHPFMIFGQQGVLKYLRSQGFETFENLFDESYDNDFDESIRVKKIVDNIKSFKYSEFDDLTNQKIRHNHNLFFDIPRIVTHIEQEIVYPILEFFENN